MKRKENHPASALDPDSATLVQRHWFYRPLVQMGLILLVGLGLYLQTMDVPFIFDDYPCIKDNPAVANFSYFTDYSKVRALVSITNDTKNSFALRPVTYLTFALNYKLGGFTVYGFHVVNTLIHLANALLIYLLTRLTVRRAYHSPPTTSASIFIHFLPLLVALLFVVHPLQTQAVTYVVQRFTSLGTFFYLSALLLYIRARTVPSTGQQRGYYAAALLITVVAMKTKEIAFTLPLIMALYDLFFLSGNVRRRLLGLAPFFLTMAIIPLTLLWLTSFQGENSAATVSQSLNLVNFAKVSHWDYLITEFGVIVVYLRMLFLPLGQNLDHDYQLEESFFAPQVFGSFLLLLTLAVAGVYAYLRSRRAAPLPALWLKLIAFGTSWFFITLSVESSLIPIDDLLVEYRVYLPSYGFFLATLSGIAMIAGSAVRRQRLVLGLLTLAIVALAVATISRNELYRDPVAMYHDVVSKSPKKPRAHISLGLAHLDKKEYDAAIEEFKLVLAAKPDEVDTLIQLGYCLAAKGQFNAAIVQFQTALKLSPNSHYAHLNLGDAYLNLGRRYEAEQEFQAALRIAPHFREARFALAYLYDEEGRRNEAIREYRKLLRDYPNARKAAKRLKVLTGQ